MSIVYYITKKSSCIKFKLRHRKGHGIHSPFVFNFINDVIEEKYQYYVYKDAERYLTNHNLIDHSKKKHQLLFRIINRFNPNNIIVFDDLPDILEFYIRAVSKNIKIQKISKSQNALSFQNSTDVSCFLADLKELSTERERAINEIIGQIAKNSFAIIDSIRSNRQAEKFWKEIIENEKIIISMDLHKIGILFFDTKYCKQHYKLSF